MAESTKKLPKGAVKNLNKEQKTAQQTRATKLLYRCVCRLLFKHKRSLNKHIKTFHPSLVPSTASSSTPSSLFHCPACSNAFPKKREFIDHISTVHHLTVLEETLSFGSFEDFNSWKKNVERETCAYYINRSSSQRNKDGSRWMMFVCNRSGFYSPTGKGERRLQIQGSRKIGGFCPSEMKVKVQRDGKCSVNFVKTHFGHGQELAHISLTPDERAAIASKIAAKIPLPEILRGIREGMSNADEIKRIDLVTMKELWNIAKYFKLKSDYMKRSRDAASVDAWVTELQKENCILFYKPQGSDCVEYPALSKDDFFLGFMNDAQASMLEIHGGDIICIDGTRGLNDFELVTLVVVDDTREGFPCAFLFTSRSDKSTLEIFFSKIRDRLKGRIPRPKNFMSDMADSFYNAWASVMGPPEKRLFCTWHVDRAWQENLSKVRTAEKKPFVYKMIRSLMEETDEDAFAKNLHVVLYRMLDDPDTVSFGAYFQRFALQPQHWAHCHRIQCGTNSNLESFHKYLEYFVQEGKKVKRVDKGLFEIIKFLHSKIFDKLITLDKEKIATKLSVLPSRHEMSRELDMGKVVVNGDNWSVPSGKGKEIHTVTKTQNREHCSCLLRCDKCKCCVHQYLCTCLDSMVSYNMCKHIHLVARKHLIETTDDYEDELSLDQCCSSDADVVDQSDEESNKRIGGLDNSVYKEYHVYTTLRLDQVCCSPDGENNSLASMKRNCFTKLNEVIAEVVRSNSVEEIAAATKIMESVIPAMRALRETDASLLTKKRKVDDC